MRRYAQATDNMDEKTGRTMTSNHEKMFDGPQGCLLIIVNANVCIYLILLLHRLIVIFLSRYLSRYLSPLFCTPEPPHSPVIISILRRSAAKISPITNIKSISSVSLFPIRLRHQICKKKDQKPGRKYTKQRKRQPDPHPETPFIARSLETQNDSIAMSMSAKTRSP